MPFIAPFKGTRYDLRRVGSLSRVVTPPYDVISPGEQRRFYRRHPCNFIRVVYGLEYRTDRAGRSRYSRARRTLQEWVRRGILREDPEPAVYPYLQEYALEGRRRRRWGVVALVRLDSPRIYPHEETRAAPKMDRLRLLKAVEASLSPIFGLIPDENGRYRRWVASAVRGQRPIGSAVLGGVRHRLWRVTRREWIAGLKGILESRDLVIADGHHRFEAALSYRNARRARDANYHPGVGYNYAMFYLAAAGAEEPGLLPTHRVVSGLSRERARELVRKAAGRWPTRAVGPLSKVGERLRWLRRRGRVGVGLCAGNGAGFVMEMTPPQRGGGVSRSSRHALDVEWLHSEVLPSLLPEGCEITFTQEAQGALRQVKRGRAQMLFVMQPPEFREVLRRARAASRMPGKTTYFHPKPLAGLVEYRF